MTGEAMHPPDSSTAKFAFAYGVASTILLILFFTPWFGALVLYGSMVTGTLGIVYGVLALRRKQPRGKALTGIILGAISVLLGAAILVFALMFTGALFT